MPAWEKIPLRGVTLEGDHVAYRMAGEGPLLLLVHGMAGSSVTWRRVMPSLAERFTVVAPDLLGQGASARPPDKYSLDHQAHTLRALLAHLGRERGTVIGQSLGGGISLQLAYRYPEHVERLALVNSGGLGPEVSVGLRLLTLPGAQRALAIGCAPDARDAARRIGRSLARAGIPLSTRGKEMWRSYVSLTNAASRDAFFRSLHDVIDWSGQHVSALSFLRATRIPLLIVWGADDKLIPPSHAYAAHRLVPGSQLVIFEGVGHYPHCEVPDRFIEVLLTFIETTQPAHVPS
jgi:pimeloyl-ACP methyl ester carboxylesterase